MKSRNQTKEKKMKKAVKKAKPKKRFLVTIVPDGEIELSIEAKDATKAEKLASEFARYQLFVKFTDLPDSVVDFNATVGFSVDNVIREEDEE